MVYMDYNATTPPTPHILDLADKLQREFWYNPNSAYKQGREARKLINKAREQCAAAIGAEPEQIFFTSCASESNAMAIEYGYYNIDGVFNSPFEHADIMKNHLSSNMIFTPYQPICYGEYDFVSTILVNNESGRMTPHHIQTYRKWNPSCFIHSDMSQAFGKITINLKDLDVDFATFSSQKIGSIRGCSVLYVKHPKVFKQHFDPLIYGHQEQGLRGGTENTVAIACMGEAMEKYNYSEVFDDVWEHYKRTLTKAFNSIPGTVVLNTNSPTHHFTNNVIQVSFKGVESESLVLMCDSQGLCISGGAACNSHSLEPSNEVKYLCRLHDSDTVNPYGVVRISYGYNTTSEDIDQTIKIITQAVTNLREINGGII